jgi:DNA replicative helicase MCM subunit Mcm2 (Cdc46/Mcm family)
VPRTIECELTEDLVDCCIPGEIVTVTGIVKVLNNFMDVGGGIISKKLVCCLDTLFDIASKCESTF